MLVKTIGILLGCAVLSWAETPIIQPKAIPVIEAKTIPVIHPVTEEGSAVPQAPATTIMIKEGETLKAFEGGVYQKSEGDKQLEVKKGSGGDVTYHLKTPQGDSTIIILVPGTTVKVVSLSDSKIEIPNTQGGTISVDAQGGMLVHIKGAPFPKGALPAGTKIEFDGSVIRCTLPMPEKLEFEEL